MPLLILKLLDWLVIGVLSSVLIAAHGNEVLKPYFKIVATFYGIVIMVVLMNILALTILL